MIGLLAKLFIKDHNNTDDPKVRLAYGTLAGVLGIVLNAVLFGVKYLAGVLTGSIAVMADAFNNLSDSGSSVITLLGFRLSAKKPDPDHPYGHGRYEYLAGLAVSLMIMLMGFELFSSSVEKLFAPSMLKSDILSFIILGVSIAVKLYMALYSATLSKKLDSAAMKATAKDSLCDVIVTSAVLLCMLIAKLFGIDLDAYFGIALSVFVFCGGIKAAKETLDPLLGQKPDVEFVKSIESIVKSCDEVIGIHDLLIHDYGPGRKMISLHAEVSSKSDLLKLHDAIDTLEKELQETLGCEAVIHMDPVADDDEKTARLKALMLQGLRDKLSAEISLHDFRIVDGPTHTNMVFDILIPSSCTVSDKQVIITAKHVAASLDGTCYAVVNVDRDYVH